ncbi:MAG: FMN-binding protein [Candidatus Omnitrophota bacterium]|jgi:electron transport complex protein RnfG
MKEMIKFGFILGFICFLASGVLAVVNGVTTPKIEAQKVLEEKTGLQEVLPAAATFKPHTQGEITDYYNAYDSSNKLIGFVIKTQTKGYSSTIEALTGLNLTLEITNIKILSQNETPGLGARITEPAFKGQFKGKTLVTFDQIQAITGATISSGGVMNSIKNKLSELNGQLSGEIKSAR